MPISVHHSFGKLLTWSELQITKDIADAMIDRIEVHANKDVIVYFKFEGVHFTDSALKE